MASDSFTYADNASLPSPWSSASGVYVLSGFKILSNACQPTGVWTSAGARYAESTQDECQVVFKSGASAQRHTFLRGNGTHLGYAIRWSVFGGNYTIITLNRLGSWFNQLSITGTYPTSSDHTVRMWITGTGPITIHASIDGVEIGSGFVDSSPLDPGNPGFVVSGDGVAVAVFDDWTDGAVAAGTTYTLDIADVATVSDYSALTLSDLGLLVLDDIVLVTDTQVELPGPPAADLDISVNSAATLAEDLSVDVISSTVELTVSDTVAVTELIEFSSGTIVTVYESVALQEDIVVEVFTCNTVVFSGVSITDTTTVAVETANIVVFDTVEITDSVATDSASTGISVYSGSSVSDVVAVLLPEVCIEVVDSCAVSESTAFYAVLNAVVNDEITLLSVTTVDVLSTPVVVSDTASITDVAGVELGLEGPISLSVSDSVVATSYSSGVASGLLISISNEIVVSEHFESSMAFVSGILFCDCDSFAYSVETEVLSATVITEAK